MSKLITRTAERLKDPFYFLKEILGINYLTPEQRAIVKHVWENKYTDVRSCHTVGKTYLEAGILLAYLFSHVNSVVITTAPTGRQVKDLLWREVNNFYSKARAKLGGVCNVMTLNIDPKWYATGVATEPGKESDSAVKIQGYHAPDIFVILDEVYGIHKSILEACDGIVSSDQSKMLCVGNPSSLNNPYSLELDKDPKRKAQSIVISAFNHPNITQKANIIPGAISLTWVEDKLRKWCDKVSQRIDETVFEYEGQLYKPSDLFRWKVLGEPPLSAVDSLVSYLSVSEAMERFKDGRYIEPNTPFKNMSLDVARFGSDKSVFAKDDSNRVTFREFFKLDVVELAEEAIKQIIDFTPDKFSIDCDGVGGGVYDYLKKWLREQRAAGNPIKTFLYAYHGGASPLQLKQTEQFLNLRAHAFWKLREDIEKLSLEYREEILEGLPALKYFFNLKGLIQIESKDDFKKRFQRSSDYEDALTMVNILKYIVPKVYTVGRIQTR